MARSTIKSNGHGAASKSSGSKYPPAYVCYLLIPAISFVVYRQASKQEHTGISADDQQGDIDGRFGMAHDRLFSRSPGGGSRFTKEAVENDAPRPASDHNFGSAGYWNERYTGATGSRDMYDWYGTWKSQSQFIIRPHVLPSMPPNTAEILQIGCGNSRLAEELVDDGYKEVTNIDFSPVVIEKMARKLSGIGGVKFLQMDASAMTFKDQSFDVVFEKGTLDAMYAGSPAIIGKVVSEVFRVLRPGGLFVSVSTGMPETRTELKKASGGLEGRSNETWSNFQAIPLNSDDRGENGSLQFFLYLMTKGL